MTKTTVSPHIAAYNLTWNVLFSQRHLFAFFNPPLFYSCSFQVYLCLEWHKKLYRCFFLTVHFYRYPKDRIMCISIIYTLRCWRDLQILLESVLPNKSIRFRGEQRLHWYAHCRAEHWLLTTLHVSNTCSFNWSRFSSNSLCDITCTFPYNYMWYCKETYVR